MALTMKLFGKSWSTKSTISIHIFAKEPDFPLPDKGPSPHPSMSDMNITVKGICNLY